MADAAGVLTADGGAVPSSGLSGAGPPARETRRLYAYNWAAFEGWCVRHGLVPLPATPPTVAAYLTALACTLGPGALARHACAVGDMHRRHGHATPGTAPLVREVLRAARQAAHAERAVSHPAVPPPSRRPPPGPDQLARMAASCPGDLAGLRDRALLLLAAAGLGHKALLGLDRDQVRLTGAGIELVLHAGAGTGDGAGASRLLALCRAAAPAMCPVRAMEAWLRSSDTRFGPVFRGVDRWGNVEHARLSADGLRRIWHRRTQGLRRRRSSAAGG